jgi:hypothetical protein
VNIILTAGCFSEHHGKDIAKELIKVLCKEYDIEAIGTLGLLVAKHNPKAKTFTPNWDLYR